MCCRGQIPAQFKLLPSESPNASKFSFRPREGTLDVGEVKTIKAQLQSDLLGAFSDSFFWSLNGSSEALRLQFKGSIVGPKFKVRSRMITKEYVEFFTGPKRQFLLIVTASPSRLLLVIEYSPLTRFKIAVTLAVHELLVLTQLSKVKPHNPHPVLVGSSDKIYDWVAPL